MTRFISALLALFALVLPLATQADPADIDAAARGVVRVVIIGSDGDEVFPISHGTGFAVSPTRIVTNAHVVREALQDDTLQIGVVPSEGDDATYARIVSVSPNNDLALIEITGSLRLPPLTLSGGPIGDSGEVSSVGYPRNVDQAQGLEIEDIFNSQPPVKSRGFISGTRPTRQFDSILHTAPIARGNSGGPLLDGCGRVIGVNSFGAESGSSEAEFYFAVSMKELIPFLNANGVPARVNELPCRSLSELDEAERARIEAEQDKARSDLAARSEEQREKRERAQLEAELEVQAERENAMLFTLLLLLVGTGAGVVAWQGWQKRQAAKVEDGATADPRDERKLMIGGSIAAVALIAALALWFTRPGLDAIDRKVDAAMAEDGDGNDTPGAKATASGALTCTLDVSRSRITGAPDETVEFGWQDDGCVNGRTQYGLASGEWSRVFVPDQDEAVSINYYDPATETFRTDRYLLGRNAMSAAREARGKYSPPSCDRANAAAELGDLQGAVTSLLPEAPNERLVYRCEVKE
ncbi:trypsin-like peptidase domain-containing protein [Parerythrobacter lacustris]|uniref:Trypsin-like peptidase domain-containing protein n=1 Tax=Parerythrobacter lacustris TaxID=2969984 RepID=A0ABT1XNY4_9SPHN|nr:trypsin-like peptidase domain-containing protein [Parerythrobacter lacustris]MCR2833292.1 trypsin-like peptidase domain-containing protein [Parerythrobacter lacustris]